MAPPKLKLDPKTIRNLASIGCTLAEIASVMGCSVDTLERRYAADIKEGREHGKATLRRLQWQGANAGNPTMLIWLGKQMLGQRDQSKSEIDTNTRIVIERLPPKAQP